MNDAESFHVHQYDDVSGPPVTAIVEPAGTLNTLSREEVARLGDARQEVAELLRSCALAVLNSGNVTDDAEAVFARHRDFSIRVVQVTRGVEFHLANAPACAFVDGTIIRGLREMLSSVVRDIIYFSTEVAPNPHFDLKSSEGITNAVFEMLRNTRMFDSGGDSDMAVCWGGHSIKREEYDYTKEVGYQLGLRHFDICTGCGPGAMKGPMKGATIAHAKQRTSPGRYVGISEPGIIAAESPNPIVNELIIMPDIEKRLEAFVRLGHGVVVFPGGAGTAEEILYVLGLLLHPDNQDLPFPLIFTGPESARDYFEEIDAFIDVTLGEQARSLYRIIVNDPAEVAREMARGAARVRAFRVRENDAFYYNWMLRIRKEFQEPFVATHEAMAGLELNSGLPTHELAANLRRAFSGIVSGNVKPEGIRAIREHGPFEIRGEASMMAALDKLLRRFVEQHRMKLPGTEYRPCYRIVG